MNIELRLQKAVSSLEESVGEREPRVLPSSRRVMFVRVALATLMIGLTALVAIPAIRNSSITKIGTADQPGKRDDGGSQVAPFEDESPPPPGSLPRSGRGSAPGVSGGSSKDSRSGGSPSEDETSGRSETAGPPVSFTDQADDAHGQDGAPPNAALSQREFDILRVDWAPVSYVNEQSPGGYSTSITVAGSARDDGEYVSWARFGQDCVLYHFLSPGTTAFANAFCDQGSGNLLAVGSVEGGPVTSTPTPSGGTRLTATFDSRTIPRELETAGRTLRNLSAFTCEGEAVVCPTPLDWADSALSYRI